jgi:Holliday junction resolvase RusA-like endonuclease
MIEFVVVGTPLSLQAGPRRKETWKRQVSAEASRVSLAYRGLLSVTIVYFCPALGVDIDNIVKPILDALVGVLYRDDRDVVQVRSIAVELGEATRITNTTPELAKGLAAGRDFVLIRVAPAQPIEELL